MLPVNLAEKARLTVAPRKCKTLQLCFRCRVRKQASQSWRLNFRLKIDWPIILLIYPLTRALLEGVVFALVSAETRGIELPPAPPQTPALPNVSR